MKTKNGGQVMVKPTEPIHYQTSWLVAEAQGRAHITSVLREIQQRRAIQQRDVLELGSGIGTNLNVFAANNRVLGIEGMEPAVQESNARGINAVQANLDEPLLLPQDSADWVLCIDVLEHLMNPVVCLESACRLLRAEGRLIVNVPNHFDWRGRMRVLRGSGIDSQNYFPESRAWEYPHVRFFKRASIEELLQFVGFAVEEDHGPEFNSFPKATMLRRLGAQRGLAMLQTRWPDLFSAGYFLVCRKTTAAQQTGR
jgi:SAM-dependent methyltransferase